MIGMTPREVDDCSLWQFTACITGWNKANGSDDMPAPPSPAEYHDMVRRLH